MFLSLSLSFISLVCHILFLSLRTSNSNIQASFYVPFFFIKWVGSNYSNIRWIGLQVTVLCGFPFTAITMSFKRTRVQAPKFLFTRRGACIAFIILIWFLFYHLPDPPSTQNNTRADRPPPEHQVEDTPRFLYRSPFRKNPDVEYEKQLSEALKEIEEAVLASQESNISEDRIWQIAKNEKHRGEDSIIFEGKHKEWEYTVSTMIRSCITWLTSTKNHKVSQW